MLRRSKNKTKTISEKVAELIAHPESGGSSAEDSDDEVTVPRVVDFEEEYDIPDARTTEIRKRNVKLLSEQSARYKGKIATRKDWEKDLQPESGSDSAQDDSEENNNYEESDSEADIETLTAFNKKLKGEQLDVVDTDSEEANQEDSVSGTEDEDSEQEAEDESDEDDKEQDDDEKGAEPEGINGHDIISKSNQQAELQKGVCVQNQLRIWERLLELRINSQKVLNKANQLPTPQVLQAEKQENDELLQALSATRQSTSHLLKQLIELQGALCHQNTEVRKALKRTAPSASIDDTTPSKRIGEDLHGHFIDFRSYRNQVLLKWDDRTKLLTPGAGAKKKTLQEDFDILKKIENTLANRNALIERSQIMKSNVPAASAQQEQKQNSVNGNVELEGHNKNDNRLPRYVHNYDDSDFYHQQLRELIEYKANTTTNMSEITKQFVELQKLRQKMKKKVDTRASKGRKLRYVVHNKLVNFMAPDERCDWTDESIKELCKSLFV